MKCPECKKEMKIISKGKNDDFFECECNPKVMYSKWVRNKLRGKENEK